MGDVTVRILTIVIQTIMALVFFYLGTLVIKRDKKRLNLIFGTFYFFIVVGTVFNWFYAFLQPKDLYYIILYLNFITNFFYFGSMGFLLVFILIVLKSEKIFGTKKQIIYLIINLGTLGGVMFLLITLPGNILGVNFPELDKSTPYWTLTFFFVVIVIISALSVGPSIYYLIQTLKHFTDKELKKKFIFFTIGYIEFCIFAYLIAIANFMKTFSSVFPTIALLLGTILVITGAYLMYIGVGKQISK